MAFIDAIGLLGSGLGIISFLQKNIPGDAPAQGAKIRVKAGNPGDNNPGLDGNIEAAYAWEINNNYLGQSDGAHIEVGGTADLTIDSFSPGSRADFTGVSVTDNALCISWITVAQYDGTTGGAWTGDIGYNCGQNWFMQTESAGYIDADANPKVDYIPRCTWLDADHTGDVPSAALKFRTVAYGKDVQGTIDNNKGCDATLWGSSNAPINSAPSRKRSFRPRQAWMEGVLVVSPTIESHKAADLCNSNTSWGPDFVGSDGKFCDMDTHTLVPLCSTEDVDGCVNIDTTANAVTRRSVGPKRAVDHPHKKYTKINQWG
ncbi:hypothetical protein V502_10809 [Pseudogymnoascus sp. VKM F-4520 (FW-2644)]|nr:hypothetical protein V502_10809 [Pseudogymnoascus sp. VKM F-4520 (FW-2644)]